VETSGQPTVEREIERDRLLQFLFTLRVLALVFGAAEVATGALLFHWPLVVVGAATLLVGIITWFARRLATAGRSQTAAKIAGYALLIIAAVAGTLAPYGEDGLLFVPIIGVAAPTTTSGQ
jgi:hypothetical protein